jgi:hypothetical protein
MAETAVNDVFAKITNYRSRLTPDVLEIGYQIEHRLRIDHSSIDIEKKLRECFSIKSCIVNDRKLQVLNS